jgi:hypothetical protein
MQESRSRRQFLTFAGGTGAVVFVPTLFSALPMQRPQPVPSPNAPNPNFPPGLNGPDIKPGSDKQTINPQNQQEIKGDVQKLYELASELKDEVEKTDANATLSLSLVKKAEQIEKLAKKVKQLSKG